LPLGPTKRVWLTKSGKAEFIPFTGLEEDPALTGADVLKLTTLRSHDQYYTTVYGLDDRYRGVFGRRDVLFISEQDLAAQNLSHGDVVEVASAIPGQEHKVIQLTAIAQLTTIPAHSLAAHPACRFDLCAPPRVACASFVSAQRPTRQHGGDAPEASMVPMASPPVCCSTATLATPWSRRRRSHVPAFCQNAIYRQRSRAS
jgi:anaerobic selenocysteine-containing dehydrogenase